MLVSTIGLCKIYSAGEAIVRAVSEVTFSIERGEFVAISGRSGSGKSTLMNLLGLLERPDRGRYFLRGRDVADLSEDARAAIRNKEIGFVFQLPALLPRASALENVELPLIYARVSKSERRRKAGEALERVGLGERMHHWPHQLSGGQQQRVTIARAIVNDPALVLADEPTGSLDSITGNEILSLFEILRQSGCTIVIVTHASDVAERAERQIALHDGQIFVDRPKANKPAFSNVCQP